MNGSIVARPGGCVNICGTRRLTEEKQLKYVFRTSNHQAADSVMAARYVLATKPDVKTIAGANEDYAWGRDSWDDFKEAMLRFKPDVKVLAELWTKIQAGEYSAEISKLLAIKADVVHSSFWGGGLITFVKQAAPRGLFKDSLVFFSVGEQSLQDLKQEMPDEVIVAPRATPAHFLRPEPEKNPLQKEFVEGMKARFGRFPDYPTSRTYQALGGLAGVLVAFTVGHIVPEYAFWIQSGEFVFMALLGGSGSVPGPLVGAIAFEFIRTYASK